MTITYGARAVSHATATVIAARRAAAVARALAQHLAHHLLLGGGLQADVQKAGAGQLDRRHPALKGRRGLQRLLKLLAQRARVGLERLGQLHGGGAGEVAMRGLTGRFKGGFRPAAGPQPLQLGRQRGEQFGLHGLHRRILRGGRRAPGCAAQAPG